VSEKTNTQLLTTTEVGHLLGITDESVRRLIRNGELPVLDVSTVQDRPHKPRYRVRDCDLAAWIEQRMAQQ
jgi:hypothetical protein